MDTSVLRELLGASLAADADNRRRAELQLKQVRDVESIIQTPIPTQDSRRRRAAIPLENVSHHHVCLVRQCRLDARPPPIIIVRYRGLACRRWLSPFFSRGGAHLVMASVDSNRKVVSNRMLTCRLCKLD